MTRRYVQVAVAVCVSMLALSAAAGARWPETTGLYYLNIDDAKSPIVGTEDDDMLLGGHGNDKMSGEAGIDVLWGDRKRSGQSTKQFDRLSGGPGRDYLYASHGFNVLNGGSGNDRINAHFGRGRIDCGTGNDVLFISHKRKARYKIQGCETIRYTRYAPKPPPAL